MWTPVLRCISEDFKHFTVMLQSALSKKLQNLEKLERRLSAKYENIGAKLSSYDKDYEEILMMSVSTSTAGALQETNCLRPRSQRMRKHICTQIYVQIL